MERQTNPQLELFSQSNDAQGFKAHSANSFLERVWNYEKTVLIIIAVLVTGIIAFSLGVERGKRSVLDERSNQLKLAVPNSAPVPAQLIVKKEEAVKQVNTLSARQSGGFTIQVASFKARANALKEAENIKKRGLSAILFNKGGYFILCAGNFPNKQAAQSVLVELNKRYGSCQIRRL
ncbi:MAG: SPOR domain-containing protein [Candidatus Omnitrophota bacterium]|nr:SPOR domain-containing protein [Candidatus Omnitrophota bacterium]